MPLQQMMMVMCKLKKVHICEEESRLILIISVERERKRSRYIMNLQLGKVLREKE